VKPILTILEPEHFSEAAYARLGEHFETMKWPQAGVIYAKAGEQKSADVAWCRLKPIDLEQLPSLKLIACNCTDVSHLPLAECQRRGIEVLSLKGIEGLDTVHATAEHTIGLMLRALRHQCDRTSGKIGRELRGKFVGVIGSKGRIGRQVTRLLLEFGADVGEPPWDSNAWNSTYDIISIHASLNETSRGMVNAEFLSKLKPGAILVNTARHAIVDEMAVLEWLNRDKEAVYAHDFAGEWSRTWLSKPELFPNHRIIGTPHIGGWTIESLHKTEELLAERVIEWAKNHLEVTV
jgi:phosphoglycerate dehydrogenase-like enzyme